MSTLHETEALDGVAIIGMAGRFPGAETLAQFWRNLRDGVESIRFYTPEELRALGVPQARLDDPAFVPAAAPVQDSDCFDAAFFGYSPREAQSMDPQQRVFLECAWHALEDAGYDPARFGAPVGVYAGAAVNSYLTGYAHQLASLADDALTTFLSNAQDFLATRVSYKLNLTGPSINIQTACSTSLVTVHLACQSLLNGECDMALAGGVSIKVGETPGYFYQDGGIASPDGHCRAFDAQAAGTLFGNGVGAVVLRRLADALEARDRIYAVIKGSAINNDGAGKIGYTAPSVGGQAAAVREALSVGAVDPATVSYVETHGTGTHLGDPVEIAALSQAFRAAAPRRQFCAIGSVKTNIGHLDTAAGIASLIKAALALQHRQIPPSLHFRTPNPEIDFASTPFYVNTELRDWPRGRTPRRAGVSSFGMGGTNAHMVLEEPPAPELEPAEELRPLHVLTLSARTPAALRALAQRYAEHLADPDAAPLADCCYTANVGRARFAHRLALAAGSAAEARVLLEGYAAGEAPAGVSAGQAPDSERPKVAFLFTGQGAQYVGMGRRLYQTQPVFRAAVDRCAAILRPLLERDIREVMFGSADEGRRTEDEGAPLVDDEGRRTEDEGARLVEQTLYVDEGTLFDDEGRRTQDEGARLVEQTLYVDEGTLFDDEGPTTKDETPPGIDRITGTGGGSLRPSSPVVGPSAGDAGLRPSSSVVGPGAGDAGLRRSSSVVGPLDQTAYTQPALFVFEYAVAELWRAWGVEPDVLLGHSVGECVAACVAGVFSLEDGLRLVATRGRLMQALPEDGAMAAVFADEAAVATALAPLADRVALAAVNGPGEAVVSGARTAVEQLLAQFEAAGVKTRRLTVSHGFHSPLIDPMLDAFERAAGRVAYRAPDIPLISNLTGRPADPQQLTQPRYWREHARAPVLFSAGLAALRERGVQVLIEVGPTPTLLNLAQRCLPEGAVRCLPSLRRGEDDWRQLLQSAAALFVAGVDLDWRAFEGQAPRRRVALPLYPFERRRHWLDAAGRLPGAPAGAPGGGMLGHRLASPLHIFQGQISQAGEPFLRRHRIGEHALVPTSAFVELACAAARAAFEVEPRAVEGLHVHELLAVGPAGQITLQTILTPERPGVAGFQIFGHPDTPTPRSAWTLYAAGKVGVAAGAPLAEDTPPESIQARCRPADAQALDSSGWARQLWRGADELLALLEPPPEQAGAAYLLHPTLLDCALHLLLALLSPGPEQRPGSLAVPMSIARCAVGGRPGAQVWCHARLGPEGGLLRLLDPQGRALVELAGVQFQQIDPALLAEITPLLAEIHQHAPAAARVLEELRAAPAAERAERLQRYLQGEVGRVLGLEPGALPDPEQGLFEQGLDSLRGLELRQRLQTQLGCTLPSTFTFNYPTVAALSAYLAREVLDLGLAAPAAGTAPAAAQSGADAAELDDLSEDELALLLDDTIGSILIDE